jgi:hypothetical protein
MARLFALLWLTAGVSACGSGDSGPPPELEKAFASESKKSSADEEALARRRAEREAEERARKEAEAARQAQIDALTTRPAQLPKDLKKACDEVAKSHDVFMRRHFASDPKTMEMWESSQAAQLAMTRQTCSKHGSLAVAACQKYALDHAPPELAKEMATLMLACADRHAPAESGHYAGAGPPPAQ